MATAMSARSLVAILRLPVRNGVCCNCRRGLAFSRSSYAGVQQGAGSSQKDSRDPAPQFLNPDVQNILKHITKFDVDQIFKSRPTPEYGRPKYKLVTDDELNKLQSAALETARHRMQMPPVMKAHDPLDTEVLSEDPEIADFDTHNIVFTDITYGIKDNSRMVVVRQTDGVLRTATPTERDRILQVYLPKPGRMYKTPKMFEEKYLERVLKNKKYEYVLDRACVQFEPDEPEYIRVVQRVYEHIDGTGSYQLLRSTRHFGGMAFYYASYHKIEGLLEEMIQNEMVDDAASLVRLYHILHPECQSAKLVAGADKTNDLELIKSFAKMDAKNGGRVELAIQTHLDSLKTENLATSS